MERRWWRRLRLATLLLGAAGSGGAHVYVRCLGPGFEFMEAVASARDLREAPAGCRELDLEIPGPAGAIRARLYLPARRLARTLVLVHGVQSDGIDGERLRRFARVLAARGHPVVTPELRDLRDYEFRVRSIDEIEAAVRWVVDRSGLVEPGERVGLMGASVGGGYCVSAAGRPGIADRLAHVTSFGGHADLYWLLDDVSGSSTPHVYPAAVMLHAFADRIVPPAQVGSLRAAVRAFLDEEPERARALARDLGSPARELVALCLERRALELGRRIAPPLRDVRLEPELSPLSSPPPRCPVFLLHASNDRVIPPEHSRALAERLVRTTRTRALQSGLVEHADVGARRGWEVVDLAAFLTDVLGS